DLRLADNISLVFHKAFPILSDILQGHLGSLHFNFFIITTNRCSRSKMRNPARKPFNLFQHLNDMCDESICKASAKVFSYHNSEHSNVLCICRHSVSRYDPPEFSQRLCDLKHHLNIGSSDNVRLINR
ncbi:unnamed protein product, partial [Arabidopsis thaliana]